ncbi:MAG: bifunctional riboflavin kinase/FAD synthetase [Desulfovibrio sp.]|nr:bifunctional riboflavin kinase/FAD synthetase [Desulfovibrio sp.]
MQILHAPQEYVSSRFSVVTIGNFDGVHLGHRSLIERTLATGRARRLTSIVVTFWPHPRCVVSPSKPHSPLSTREKRSELLSALNIDVLLELPFTPSLAALSPLDFVQEYLLPLRMKHLVTGYDFCLGKGRSGHTAELAEIGRTYGFSVEQMPALLDGDLIVSSTRLRKLIAEGNVSEAALLLGRPYGLEGPVVHGFGRGKGLGFPTANIAPTETLLPAEGVYAAGAMLGGKCYPCLVNIGRNPTFDGNDLSVEAYLLDVNVDCYGSRLAIFFIDRLREERRFADAEALSRQITADIERARVLFAQKDFACG